MARRRLVIRGILVASAGLATAAFAAYYRQLDEGDRLVWKRIGLVAGVPGVVGTLLTWGILAATERPGPAGGPDRDGRDPGARRPARKRRTRRRRPGGGRFRGERR